MLNQETTSAIDVRDLDTSIMCLTSGRTVIIELEEEKQKPDTSGQTSEPVHEDLDEMKLENTVSPWSCKISIYLLRVR